MACESGCRSSAASSLNDAAQNQERKSWRQSAEKRGDGEAGDGGHQQPLAAEAARQPAGHGKNDGVGDQVRRQRPSGFVVARRQAAGDVRQRDVDHGRVQHLHEGARHDGNRDQPGIDVAVFVVPGERHPSGQCSVIPEFDSSVIVLSFRSARVPHHRKSRDAFLAWSHDFNSSLRCHCPTSQRHQGSRAVELGLRTLCARRRVRQPRHQPHGAVSQPGNARARQLLAAHVPSLLGPDDDSA